MAALYTQGLPCPSPPTPALPPQVNRSRVGNGPWWWRRAPRTGGAHPGRRKRGRRASQAAHRCMGCRGQGTARIGTSAAGKGTFRRVQRPAPGTICPPPPPQPAPAPPGSRGLGKGQSPPLRCSLRRGNGTYLALRCPPPPPASPPRRSDGTAGKARGLMRAQSGYNPPTGGGVAPLVSGSRSRRPALPINTRK